MIRFVKFSLIFFLIWSSCQGAPSLDVDEEEYFTGLKHPDILDRKNDPEVEDYLSRLDKFSVPESFDARDKGWIGEPKHQKSCGSCVVFTNVALIETCIARVSCSFSPDTCTVGDLSEQEALECAYNPPDVDGCDGALSDSYISWIINRGGYMSDELNLPYRPSKLTHECPTDVLVDDKHGVKITGEIMAYDVDEEMLKSMVYYNGAVQTSIAASDDGFKHYSGGIFGGCTTNKTNHGIVIVGYGSEVGEDYWILKNSWGTKWGEGGYMRLKRGVSMCGIGEMVVAAKCRHITGTTMPPYTTTTTEATPKEECDMSEFFHGYPITVNGMHLSITFNGVNYRNKVNCKKGLCAPVDMTDIVNACSAICGRDPCSDARMRGFDDLDEMDVTINSMNVDDFLRSIDIFES